MVEVPDWLPYGVGQMARRLVDLARSGGPPEAIEVLRRLILDPRMENVWRELSKHPRRNYVPSERPFHSSTLPPAIESWPALAAALRIRATEYRELGDEASADMLDRQAAAADVRGKGRAPGEISLEEQHQMALVTLFGVAVSAYLNRSSTFTRKEVDSVIAKLEATGKDDLAAAYRRHAADPRVAPFIVTRRRTDPRLEAFVETLARETTKLFGSPLYGVIATIANVAFERSDLSRRGIRAILNSRTPAGPRAA
ncbi:MAG TPA: hypothetical protein VLX09_19800 [Stellaceae bacterium]|nr:hypothetical protein [Stellaceae bacterium]